MLSEYKEQECLFEWVSYTQMQYPELKMLFHVPNGGRRDAATGRALKRRGVRAGGADLFLAYPSNGYHGCFVELKVGKNKPTRNQNEWLDVLQKNGYYTRVCYGWIEARDTLIEYITHRVLVLGASNEKT